MCCAKFRRLSSAFAAPSRRPRVERREYHAARRVRFRFGSAHFLKIYSNVASSTVGGWVGARARSQSSAFCRSASRASAIMHDERLEQSSECR